MAALPTEAKDGVESFLSLDGVDFLLFDLFYLYELFKEVDCLSDHLDDVWILLEFLESMGEDH